MPNLQADGLDILKILSRDSIDSVRISSVDSIMFNVYDPKVRPAHQTFSTSVWAVLKLLFEDSCWRVKYATILKISDICSSAGKENVKKLILPYYAKFLVDDEKEVAPPHPAQMHRHQEHPDAGLLPGR